MKKAKKNDNWRNELKRIQEEQSKPVTGLKSGVKRVPEKHQVWNPKPLNIKAILRAQQVQSKCHTVSEELSA